MSDKPLHVRVAEALGSMVRLQEGWWERLDGAIWTAAIPRYDTDWSATGPLIEKYGITVTPGSCLGQFKSPWVAARDFVAECDGWASDEDADGPTPLLAACNLLLALKAAGKLEQA
jgi:hypothetical protein